METMRAFHGDPSIKEKYLARVRAHLAADELVKGETGYGGRGCAVWCTLNAYDHAQYPIELGIPAHLARLEDCIFEGLPSADSMQWPARFLSAINTGANLDMVWSRFALWLLETELGKYPTSAPVAALYRRRLTGDEPTVEKWRSAAAAYSGAAADAAAGADYADSSAAYSAAAADAAAGADYADSSAAYAAAAADAAAGADYADSSAAYATAAAAAAAGADDFRWALRSAAWQRFADKLIELLKEAR